MSSRTIVAVLFAALASAASTWLVGWWSVPIVAAAAGAWTRSAWPAVLGAVLGWGLLLAIDAAGGRFGAVASTTAAVIGIPTVAMPLVTLLFVAALAWSAAALADSAVGLVARGRRTAT